MLVYLPADAFSLGAECRETAFAGSGERISQINGTGASHASHHQPTGGKESQSMVREDSATKNVGRTRSGKVTIQSHPFSIRRL
jgi:hypothetical protein